MMTFPKHLLSIYGAFLRFSFSKASEFRFDAAFRILMDLAFFIQFYLLLDVTFSNTETLNGWGREQAMLFLAIFLVVDALFMIFIDANLEELPHLVVKGGFDYYLLRPVPSLFQVLLRQISLPSIVNLTLAVVFLCYAVSSNEALCSWGSTATLAILILNGFFLTAALRLLFTIGVFWGMSERGLLPVYWAFSVLFEKPHVIYRGIIKYVGLSLLPFALTASLPAEIMALPRDHAFFHLAYLFGMSFLFFTATLVVWKLALRNYSSASS